MKQNVILLLNLAILVVNFFVASRTSDAQVRVLRTTARVAHSAPVAPPRSVPEPLSGAVPVVRLLKYLGRLEELDRLTPQQVEAVFGSLEYCCAVAAEGGEELRAGALDGARTRRGIGSLHDRMRRNVVESLRAARIEEERLISQLVRIVLSSTG